jgi:hypothetical protein
MPADSHTAYPAFPLTSNDLTGGLLSARHASLNIFVVDRNRYGDRIDFIIMYGLHGTKVE